MFSPLREEGVWFTSGTPLTHGFDDEGRQFDARGSLEDGWTKQDSEELSRRASCISDRDSGFVNETKGA